MDPRVLSLLSHELRSPLGVVRGYLRMLEQLGSLSDQQQSAVAAALRASTRAAELLDQASMLAQLQRGDTPFDFKPVDLQTTLVAAVDAVPLPSDPTIRLEMTEVPTVLLSADESLLGSVFRTVLSALVKAQAQDTTIRVTAIRETRDAIQGVAVSFTPGTAPDTLRETDLNISRGGVGLDLPIAERLIAAHRGQLRELRAAEVYGGVLVWLPAAS